jgi:hypothetical protein
MYVLLVNLLSKGFGLQSITAILKDIPQIQIEVTVIVWVDNHYLNWASLRCLIETECCWRLKTTGFGETKPIASNKTAKKKKTEQKSWNFFKE